jgi:hypothetical protein
VWICVAGVLVAPKPSTVRQVGERWLHDAEEGNIRNRSGDRYKPSSLRGYEQALREYIYPAIGGVKLHDIRPSDVQRLVDDLVARGLNPSTVRNALLPLRAICRRAIRQGDLSVNPTTGVEVPAVRGGRSCSSTRLRLRIGFSGRPRSSRASAVASSKPSAGRTSISPRA